MAKEKVIKKETGGSKKTVAKTVKKALPKEEKKEDIKKVVVDPKKLSKVITGTVVSTKMINTVVVSYTRKVAHKRYGKLLKVTKRIQADTNGMEVLMGDTVKIQQTKPISKNKFFKVIKREEDKSLGK